MRDAIRCLGLIWAAAAALVVSGCAATIGAGAHGPAPDYYMTTAVAYYKPVDIPGTQRRQAQQEAENDAKKQLLDYVGAMPARPGQTVNDLIAKNSRIRAKVLETVRTAEVVDWYVTPECGSVQVWVRLDLNRIRELAALCP